MNRNDAFPSKYLKKEDLTSGPITATIRHVEMGEVGTEDNKDTKPIMFFREEDIKPMVINSGNWDTCAEMFGDESDNWARHQIEIYVDPNVKYAGKKVGGLRLRTVAQIANKQAAPVALAIDNEALMARWSALWHKAQELGIDSEPLKPDATFEEAVERGKALKAQIELAQL